MATYLDRILAAHRAAADADRRDVAVLEAAAAGAPGARPFAAALRAAADVAVIAEIKRASPSKGPLTADLDVPTLVAAYEAGGATCLSVLTDREFFAGSVDDLQAAKAASRLPVLRKDFTVGPADVYDARLMGADAVLLIVAALSASELGELVRLAGQVGLDALVEVHDEAEADVALAAGATMIGVNQRDLVTFEVDTHRAERVGRALPAGVVRVAESGIVGRDDVVRLGAAGFDAVLIGEHLVTAADPAAALRAVRTAGPVPLGQRR
jgi:indole-3-glycerol phosphate synthase